MQFYIAFINMRIYIVYILWIVLHIYMQIVQKIIEYMLVQYFFAFQTTFGYAEYSAYGCAPLKLPLILQKH